jgi:hypothetical protein|tara:strand:- start:445 stop:657 length:213 start_codon:yes stop_codon:yes gene_type:complete
MGGFVRKRILKKKKPVQQIQRAAVKDAPSGPTQAELERSRLISNKRRGRKATKLGFEDEDISLAYKTLLG